MNFALGLLLGGALGVVTTAFWGELVELVSIYREKQR